MQSSFINGFTMKKITKKELRKKEKRQLRKEFKNNLEVWKQAVIIRDNDRCVICNKLLQERKEKHPHHVIILRYLLRHCPELLTKIENGLLLCAYHHRFADTAAHQNGFWLALFLKEHRPEQFNFLYNFLKERNLI